MSIRNENRPGYKKTKIGWIPEEWNCVRLREIAPVCTNGFVGKATDHYSEEKNAVLYVQGYNVNVEGIDYTGMKRVALAFHKKQKRSELKEGDILTIQTGEIGTSVLVPKDLEGANCHALIITRLKKEVSDTRYYAHYFNSSYGMKSFVKISTGSGLKHLNCGDVKELYVPCPDVNEQRRIATILSAWDRAIDQVRALIESKKKLKKGLMQQLLTGRMRFPEFGKPAKKGQLPEGWRQVKIGDLLEEVSRPVNFNDETFYPLISVRRNSGGAFYRETLKGSNIATKNLFVTKQGDFLISKMQVLHGAMAMTPAEFDGMHISGSYISLVPKNKNDFSIEYFNYLAQTPKMYHKAYISSHGVHIEKMTFDLDLFLNEKVVVPAKKEQEKIVRTIRSIEQTIGLLEASVEHFRQQKKGLMQKLLTGEVRVHLAKNK